MAYKPVSALISHRGASRLPTNSNLLIRLVSAKALATIVDTIRNDIDGYAALKLLPDNSDSGKLSADMNTLITELTDYINKPSGSSTFYGGIANSLVVHADTVMKSVASVVEQTVRLNCVTDRMEADSQQRQ
jgi:hypothetical protein